MMRKRDLAGARVATAADQRNRRRGVMRRAIGAASPRFDPEAAGQRLECGRLERLGLADRRQDAGVPLREHRLGGAGWAGHEDVVSLYTRLPAKTTGRV